MSTSSQVRIDRSTLLGLLAYVGTFLLIPIWDIYALVYTILTGLRGRRDPTRAAEATAIIVQPIRRLIFVGLAFGLAFAGLGVSQAIIQQPGPFGFLATGISNLPRWAVDNGIVAAEDCCDLSAVVAAGDPVRDLVNARIGNSLALLVGGSVVAGLLAALLMAVALHIRQREMRLSIADGILLLLALIQPVLIWPGLIPLEIGLGLLMLCVLGIVFLPDLHKRQPNGSFLFRLTQRRVQLDLVIHGVLRLLAFRVMAAPVMGLSLLAVMFLGIRFHVIPIGGVASFQAGGFLDRLWHLLGPAFAIAILPALLSAQAGVRAWIEWDETGRPSNGRLAALGLAAARAFMEQAGWLISALLVVELIFAYNGVAALLLTALQAQDAPLLIGALSVFPVWMLVARLRAALTAGAQRAFEFDAPEGKPAARAAAMRDDLLQDIEPRKLWGGVALLLVLFLIASNVFGTLRSPYGSREQVGQPYQLPSETYARGTDQAGRDVQAHLLEAQRVTFLIALQAGLIALAIGGVWGGAVVVASKVRGVYGESFADFLRLGAEAIVILHPALVALLFTVARSARPTGADGGGQSLSAWAYLLGMAVVPRMALGLEALWTNAPQAQSIRRRLVGVAVVMLLGATFAAWQYAVAASFLNFGVQFPVADLGNTLSGYGEIMAGTGAVTDARFYILLANLTGAAGFQAFALYLLQDAAAEWFGFTRRDFLPRLFA